MEGHGWDRGAEKQGVAHRAGVGRARDGPEDEDGDDAGGVTHQELGLQGTVPALPQMEPNLPGRQGPGIPRIPCHCPSWGWRATEPTRLQLWSVLYPTIELSLGSWLLPI